MLTGRVICDNFLCGIMIYQFFHWLRVREKDDRKLHRYIVLWVMFMNIAETVLYVQHAWRADFSLMEWTVFNFVS